MPLDGLDTYEIAPGISGELLRPMTATGGDLRMHVTNGAAASFAETLPLLHPFGRLQCHDIFVTGDRPVPHRLPRAGQVRRVRRQLGERPAARAHRRRARASTWRSRRSPRPGSNIITLTADVRD